MKKILVLAFAAFMSLAAVTESFARGGGGGSSSGGGSRGGSSFSSGGGFGRSSSGSSGSSEFFKSSPSPSLPPARYSAPPSPSKPAAPAPSPSRSTTPPSSTPKYTAPSSSPSKPQPSAPVSKPVENHKFFAGDKGQTVPGYDKKAVEAQKHVDSAKAYAQAQAKKESVSVKPHSQEQSAPVSQPKAQVHDIASARDKRATELSTRIARGQYREREVRANSFYGDTYSQPMPSYYGGGYSDSFGNPYFWYWLMNRNDSVERDRFIYHRQDEIDPKRLQEMKSVYPELSASLDRFKNQGLQRDKGYTPAKFAGNEDLIYGDDVVKQATHKASEIRWVGWFFLSALGLAICFAVYYLLFGVKWKVREHHA